MHYLPQLDVEGDKEALKRQLQSIDANLLVRMERGTKEELQNLLQSPGGCVALHMSCHGIDDPQRGFCLVFEDGDKEGRGLLIRRHDIQEIFDIGPKPQVVVAMACHSGGCADVFVNVGVPHVVAITQAWTVMDTSAIKFSAHFWRYLAEGATVEQAFRCAQQVINDAFEKRKFELTGASEKHDEQIFFPPGANQTGRPQLEVPNPIPTNTLQVYHGAFVGRKHEQFLLIDQLMSMRSQRGSNIHILKGPADVGKSVLARAVAEYGRVRGFFGGLCLADFSENRYDRLSGALQEVADALDRARAGAVFKQSIHTYSREPSSQPSQLRLRAPSRRGMRPNPRSLLRWESTKDGEESNRERIFESMEWISSLQEPLLVVLDSLEYLDEVTQRGLLKVIKQLDSYAQGRILFLLMTSDSLVEIEEFVSKTIVLEQMKEDDAVDLLMQKVWLHADTRSLQKLKGSENEAWKRFVICMLGEPHALDDAKAKLREDQQLMNGPYGRNPRLLELVAKTFCARYQSSMKDSPRDPLDVEPERQGNPAEALSAVDRQDVLDEARDWFERTLTKRQYIFRTRDQKVRSKQLRRRMYPLGTKCLMLAALALLTALIVSALEYFDHRSSRRTQETEQDLRNLDADHDECLEKDELQDYFVVYHCSNNFHMDGFRDCVSHREWRKLFNRYTESPISDLNKREFVRWLKTPDCVRDEDANAFFEQVYKAWPEKNMLMGGLHLWKQDVRKLEKRIVELSHELGAGLSEMEIAAVSESVHLSICREIGLGGCLDRPGFHLGSWAFIRRPGFWTWMFWGSLLTSGLLFALPSLPGVDELVLPSK